MIEDKIKDGEKTKKRIRNDSREYERIFKKEIETEHEIWREKTKKCIRNDRRKDEIWRKKTKKRII